MKPDVFEIFGTFSRYLEKKSRISGNIFRRFFVIFVGLRRRCCHLSFQSRKKVMLHGTIRNDDF